MRKLPGFEPAPAGLERQVLRRLPAILLYGTVLPAVLGAFLPDVSQLRYVLFGLVLTNCMLVLAATFLCLIVVVMKGHAWVADAYGLPDGERPLASKRRARPYQ